MWQVDMDMNVGTAPEVCDQGCLPLSVAPRLQLLSSILLVLPPEVPFWATGVQKAVSTLHNCSFPFLPFPCAQWQHTVGLCSG
jgi:hypothetical protein